MGVQVYQPTGSGGRKQEEMAILPVAGTIVGSMLGGPAGGAAGGVVGGQVAGKPAAPAQGVQTSGAVDRRQQELQNAQALADAQAAVSQDPRLQKQLGPTLAQAQQQNALQRRQAGMA